MNLLELVPAFQRHIGKYKNKNHTESDFAAYLADAVQALMVRWNRDYVIEFTSPHTYVVTPDITDADRRPIILMASIIYKMGNFPLASFQDGDFSFNPHKSESNAIELDRKELLNYLGSAQRLVAPSTAPLRGYAYAFNRESYAYFLAGGWIGQTGWGFPIGDEPRQDI